jgi:hypothetical protein
MNFDRFDFNALLPFLIILFAIIGWFFATGSGKTQYVRIIDIIIYGPFLIYLSLKKSYDLSSYEKVFLLFLGITTISYNLKNFIGEL